MYRANIYIITNQNGELYSVRPQDFQHGRPDYEHFKTASYIGVTWGLRQWLKSVGYVKKKPTRCEACDWWKAVNMSTG